MASTRPASRSQSSSSAKLDPAAFDKLLSHVPEEFFAAKDFNPFAHYDDDPQSLQDYAQVLDLCVQRVVNVHHKNFTGATLSFTRVLETFSQSQKSLSNIHQSLIEARSLLGSSVTNDRVREFWFAKEKYQCCLLILRKIEFVRFASQTIKDLKSHKFYLHSVLLLTRALSLLNHDDLREVDGLIELREILLEEKIAILEEIVAEIHTVIYQHHHSQQSLYRESVGGDSGYSTINHREVSVSSQQPRTSGNDTQIYSSTQSSRQQPSVTSANGNASSTKIASRRSGHRKNRSMAGGNITADSAANSAMIAIFSRIESSPFNPFTDCPASLQALLAQERSHPHSHSHSHSHFLSFLVVACHELNALPSVRTQLTKRLKSEISSVIDRELAVIRESYSRMHSAAHTTVRSTNNDGASANGASNILSTLSRHDELVLQEICTRVFPLLCSILRHHIDVHTQIQQCLGASDSQGVAPVWETVQIAAQMLLLELLQSGPVMLTTIVNASSSANKSKRGGDVELTFSFDDSRILSVAKMSRNQQSNHKEEVKESDSSENVTLPIVSPSPYHLTVLYRPVISFIEQSHSLLSSHAHAQPSNQLKDFLSMFLTTAFLPRVTADVNRSLESLLHDPRAFEVAGTQLRTIRCVYHLVTLIRSLIASLYRLPHTVNELLSMIDGLVQRFTERCSDHCSELTRGSFSGTAIMDTKIIELAKNDPAFITFNHSHSGNNDSDKSSKNFVTQNNPLYSPLLEGDLVLKRSQLIDGSRALQQLSLMSESFEWLADQLYSLTQQHQHSHASASLLRAATVRPVASFRAALVSSATSQSTSRSMLSSRVFDWCRWCLALSDRCLANLRFELHCRTLNGLAPLRTSNYGAKSVSSEEPEPFVLALNTDLTAFDDAINQSLSSQRLHYVYAGFFSVLAAGIETNLLKVREKRFSPSGAALLHRDLMSLQQQANSLTSEQSQHWDSIKVLIDLLPLSEAELDEQASNIQLSADHAAILTSVRQANRRQQS